MPFARDFHHLSHPPSLELRNSVHTVSPFERSYLFMKAEKGILVPAEASLTEFCPSMASAGASSSSLVRWSQCYSE